jgi:hypothetical protein
MDRIAATHATAHSPSGDLYNGALDRALWMTGPGLSSKAADFLAPLRNTTLLARLITLELLHTEVARPGCKINSAANERSVGS